MLISIERASFAFETLIDFRKNDLDNQWRTYNEVFYQPLLIFLLVNAFHSLILQLKLLPLFLSNKNSNGHLETIERLIHFNKYTLLQKVNKERLVKTFFSSAKNFIEHL